jgi:hypothetical protein
MLRYNAQVPIGIIVSLLSFLPTVRAHVWFVAAGARFLGLNLPWRSVMSAVATNALYTAVHLIPKREATGK